MKIEVTLTVIGHVEFYDDRITDLRDQAFEAASAAMPYPLEVESITLGETMER